jgi:hypothetical protein
MMLAPVHNALKKKREDKEVPAVNWQSPLQ